MMICENCGEIFDEPEMIGQQRAVYSELDVTAPEVYCCPACKSEDIFEAHECAVCGSLSADEICSECKKRLNILADKAHRISREVYFDLAASYAKGIESAREYIEDLF